MSTFKPNINADNITNLSNSFSIIRNNDTKIKYHVNTVPLISIYENLSSGGANVLALSNIRYLKNKYRLNIISDKIYTRKIKNIFSYLKYVYFDQFHFKIFNFNKLSKSNILISYHSWVTKSPLILRLTNIPQIYVCHEPPREFYDTNYMNTFSIKEIFINFLRYGIKIIDKQNVTENKNLVIISNSKYSKNLIDKVYKVKSSVIYPGINIKNFGTLSSFTDRKNIILCVGSINKLKNQLGILHIIANTHIKSDYQIIFVGNGGEKNYIEKVINYANINNIRLKIYTDMKQDKLTCLYKQAKLFVYMPLNEPFGIVVLEAMRAGLPIITTNNESGYLEVLNKFTGKIISPINYKMWEKWINMFLSNEKYWTQYSKYNYKYSKNFSEEVMNKKLELIIMDTIKKYS